MVFSNLFYDSEFIALTHASGPAERIFGVFVDVAFVLCGPYLSQ